MRIFLLLATVLLTSCGTPKDPQDGSDPVFNGNTESELDEAIATTEGSEAIADENILFNGYVGGVFEVEVDGTIYGDIEDFYTSELDKIPGKLREAGYSDDLTFKFDAQIGFEDLWRGMTVYIAPKSNRGYQGTSTVGRDGLFEVSLPIEASDNEFQVRSNKRIGLVVQDANDTHKICYNFSAIDFSVTLDAAKQPIVLTKFVTKITKYQCQVPESSGVVVPNPTDHVKKLGDSKATKVQNFCLSGDCQAQVGMSIKAGTPTVLESGCIYKTGKAVVYGGNIHFFYVASCQNQKSQAYHLIFNPTSQIASSPSILSQDCFNQDYPVYNIAASAGEDQLVAIYGCGPEYSYNRGELRSISMDSLGNITQQKIQKRENYVDLKKRMALSWHPSQKTWALVREHEIQLLDPDLQQIGGQMAGASGDQMVNTETDDWLIISGTSTKSCSKINSDGVKLCDKKYLHGQTFLSSKYLLSFDTYANRIDLYDFSPQSCSDSRIGTIGSTKNGGLKQYFNAVRVSENFGLSLVGNGVGSLEILSIALTNAPKIVSSSTMINFNSGSTKYAEVFRPSGDSPTTVHVVSISEDAIEYVSGEIR